MIIVTALAVHAVAVIVRIGVTVVVMKSGLVSVMSSNG